MKIRVIHPFSLRPGSGKPVREFPAGDHTISPEEHEHWFMQACLSPEDGRAVLLADADEDEGDSGELASPTREELEVLTVATLKDIAAAVGLRLDAKANKAEIVDALLAGQENKVLVKNDDGFYELKEA